ncbi:MAG: hypothetical protein ACPHI5_05905, partial [Acidimicrobiales bacterium]
DIESRSPMTTSGAMPSDIALSKPESTARTSSNFGRKSITRLSGQGPPLMINALFLQAFTDITVSAYFLIEINFIRAHKQPGYENPNSASQYRDYE